jgi:hypothetical protein
MRLKRENTSHYERIESDRHRMSARTCFPHERLHPCLFLLCAMLALEQNTIAEKTTSPSSVRT